MEAKTKQAESVAEPKTAAALAETAKIATKTAASLSAECTKLIEKAAALTAIANVRRTEAEKIIAIAAADKAASETGKTEAERETAKAAYAESLKEVDKRKIKFALAQKEAETKEAEAEAKKTAAAEAEKTAKTASEQAAEAKRIETAAADAQKSEKRSAYLAAQTRFAEAAKKPEAAKWDIAEAAAALLDYDGFFTAETDELLKDCNIRRKTASNVASVSRAFGPVRLERLLFSHHATLAALYKSDKAAAEAAAALAIAETKVWSVKRLAQYLTGETKPEAETAAETAADSLGAYAVSVFTHKIKDGSETVGFIFASKAEKTAALAALREAAAKREPLFITVTRTAPKCWKSRETEAQIAKTAAALSAAAAASAATIIAAAAAPVIAA